MSPSPAGPTSPREAVELMLARVEPVGTQRVALAEASGRVLAEDVVADRPSPAADVSAMDGYAVRLGELRLGRLPVTGEIRIGLAPPPLPAGAALRIVTGAPVPAGAEAVVKREDVEEHDRFIVVPAATSAAARSGQSIRRKGENAGAGELIVEAGREIGPSVSAALASVGVSQPLVHGRVRVGVLVTGDELLDVDATPTAWQLRDSNGPALRSLLAGCVWIEIVGVRRAADEPGEIGRAAGVLLAASDLLFMSGGVSMGTRDFVPAVLSRLGAETLFHKVPQRPGRPVLGAVTRDGKAVLALPGNPVSVLVTARWMGGPVLRRLAGIAPDQSAEMVRVVNTDGRLLDIWWHRLVRLTGPGTAELVDGKGSGDIASAARSDGFVEVPPEEDAEGPWPMYRWGL